MIQGVQFLGDEPGQFAGLGFGDGQHALGGRVDPEAESDVVTGNRDRSLRSLESLLSQVATHSQEAALGVVGGDLDSGEETGSLGRCSEIEGERFPTAEAIPVNRRLVLPALRAKDLSHCSTPLPQT
jgi:hypothetical protein